MIFLVKIVEPKVRVGLLSAPTFFGLTSKYRIELHKTLAVLMTKEAGVRFTYQELYNMPVYLRNFYLDEIVKYRQSISRKFKR